MINTNQLPLKGRPSGPVLARPGGDGVRAFLLFMRTLSTFQIFRWERESRFVISFRS